MSYSALVQKNLFLTKPLKPLILLWWAMTGSNCRPSRCKRDRWSIIDSIFSTRRACNIIKNTQNSLQIPSLFAPVQKNPFQRKNPPRCQRALHQRIAQFPYVTPYTLSIQNTQNITAYVSLSVPVRKNVLGGIKCQ